MFIVRSTRDLSPWRELSVPNRIARLFGEPFASEVAPEPLVFNPVIDVAEQEDQLVITAELPGMAKEEVELQVESGMLTIKGEKKVTSEQKSDRMHLIERSYGHFERSFALPQYADFDKVKAEFENGVLVITVPKLAQVKGRKVQIYEK